MVRMAKSMFKARCEPSGLPKPGHTVVAGIEHQVLELVRFIDKEVVNTHHLEIHGIVLALGDAVLYVL